MAGKARLEAEFISNRLAGGRPQTGPVSESEAREDKAHEIQEVCLLHNETATRLPVRPLREIRHAIRQRRQSGDIWSTNHFIARIADYRTTSGGRRVTIGGAQQGA